MNNVQMKDVEEHRYPSKYPKRPESRRNLLAIEPGEQHERRPQRHQQKLQRWRIFLDIQKQDRSLSQRRLKMEIALRNTPQTRRRIAVKVREPKQGERRNHSDTQQREEFLALGPLHPIKLS